MKTFRFSIHGQKFEVDVKSRDERTLLVEVNGTSYEVELDKEIRTTKTPVLVRTPVPLGSPLPEAKSSGNMAVNSPLPGTILSIAIKAGDKIKKGQKILVLEAMKMENSIQSDYDGEVVRVGVSAGDQILQGALLYELKTN